MNWNTWDCPLTARPKDSISQRPFGGHTNNDTGKPVTRACHAADRTGHMILQTLYQQCIKNNVTFFDEYQVLDLLMTDGKAAGVVAIEIATGEMHIFHAKAVIFATGGHGRIWEITSNAYAYTGDGVAITLPQRHPAGGYGVLPISPDRYLQDLAFSSPKVCAVKAACCSSMARANASWTSTPPP